MPNRQRFGFVSAAERRRADRFFADLFGVASRFAAEADGGENWIPTPSFPARASNLAGSAFMATIANVDPHAQWQAREDAMVAQLLAGNVPGWLQRWITVKVSRDNETPEVT